MTLLLLSGCSTSTADDLGNKYAQTWERSYSETTCADWTGEMTAQQKFAAAADILVAAWTKIEGSSQFPDDSMINEFRDGIGTACVVPTMNISEVSYGVYSTEARFTP